MTNNGEELKMLCAVWATNRQALIDHINSLVNPEDFQGQEGSSYLYVALRLGCARSSASYATEADMPERSVPCPCGNPKHWLIRYGEEFGSKEEQEKVVAGSYIAPASKIDA